MVSRGEIGAKHVVRIGFHFTPSAETGEGHFYKLCIQGEKGKGKKYHIYVVDEEIRFKSRCTRWMSPLRTVEIQDI